MRQSDRQTGSSIVGILAVIVALAVIGSTGWIVYLHNRTRSTKAASNTNQSANSYTTPTQPASTVAYLTIKEWGIKLPLPDGIKDAYYIVDPGVSTNEDGRPSAIEFGLTTKDASCGAVSATDSGYAHALGAIVRTFPIDTDPVSGKLYTQLDPNGVTIGGYYYGYASSSLKSKTCISATTIQVIDSALANAVKAATPSTAN